MTPLRELVVDLGLGPGINDVLELSPEEALQQIEASTFPLAADAAIYAVLCHAVSMTDRPLSARVIKEVAQWLWPRPAQTGIVVLELLSVDQRRAVEFLERIVDEAPAQVAVATTGAILLNPEQYGPMLIRIARDHRPRVREHLFALLGEHRRLVVPGSLKWRNLSVIEMAELLQTGISDAEPSVRARAIAAAYGFGAVDLVLGEVLHAVHDPDSEVRMYALVALGTATDEAGRSLLKNALEGGVQQEATSAIWALSRRPDGIQCVLELVGDTRPWVVSALTGAIAEVSVPLSDQQLATVANLADFPGAMRDVVRRHIDRTRNGAREHGPEGHYSFKTDDERAAPE